MMRGAVISAGTAATCRRLVPLQAVWTGYGGRPRAGEQTKTAEPEDRRGALGTRAMRLTARLRPGTEARFPGVACKEAARLTETPTISHTRTHAHARNCYVVEMADGIRIKQGS